ncbi:MAG: extracellular solute-binding protein [Rhodoluna sp.]|nr:extracellular solute-binding protein [Rhodoluna sp.]
MKIRKSGIAAVAGLATAALLAVATPSQATDPSILIWVDNGAKPVVQKVIYDWASDKSVDVTIVGKDFGAVRDLLKTAVPGGTGPDILAAAPHDWTGDLAAAGVLRPVTLSTAVKAGLQKNAYDAFLYGGQHYGVPGWTENIAVLRNPKFIKAPIAKVTDIPAGKIQIGTWGATGSDPYHFYPVQTSFGADVFASTSAGWSKTLGMTGAKGAAFANFLNTKKAVFFGGADTPWNTAICNLINGKRPLWVSGPWAIDAVKNGVANSVATPNCAKGISVAAKTLAIDPFWKGTDGKTAKQFMGVRGFYLTSSANTDLATANSLLSFIAGKDSQVAFYTKANKTPANLAALKVASANPVIKGFATAGATAVPMPNIPAMDSVWDKWGKVEGRILTGHAVGSAAADWAATMTEIQALVNG